MPELAPQTHEQLLKPNGGEIRFSDVYPELITPGEDAWWRMTDFDSTLTEYLESGRYPDLMTVPIGFNRWFANYGLVLADDLAGAQAERLAGYTGEAAQHPDTLKELAGKYTAKIAEANWAPRDEENTKNGANGSDFYMALTENGLEIYTTPLSFLSDLDARHRVLSLYRIPTRGHPEFDGDNEQYRSARIVRSRRHPDIFVPVFEYENREQLIEAKRQGTHPAAIPEGGRSGHFVFVDRFGNTKYQEADLGVLDKCEVGKFATLQVVNQGIEQELGVRVVESLRAARPGEFVVYTNRSDRRDPGSKTGFVELVVKVDEDPATSRKTAAFALSKEIENLDFPTAGLALAA